MKLVTLLAALLLSTPACKDNSAPPPPASVPGGSAASATPPPTTPPTTPPKPTTPACGMATNPGLAKDLGKATIKVDGEELCGNYWHTHGFAKGQRFEVSMLDYASDTPPTLTGPASSKPSETTSKQRYALLDPATPIAIGLNLAHKFNEREYVSVQLELAGFPLSAWDGKALSASIERDGLGWVMMQDRSKRTSFALVEIQRGSAPRETLYGKSGTFTIDSYELPKKAFRGSFAIKVGPVAGLGQGKERPLEGSFAIRAFD